MVRWRPDPTFYPTARMAMQAPAERLAYVVMLDGKETKTQPDALGCVDVDPASPTYGRLVGQTDLPRIGDELHHFGWNACSACLSPSSPHPHVERRYLIVPGIGSSYIYVLDTRDTPTQPRIVRTITPEELADRAGYSAPHTVHCGPEGIFVSALGAADGGEPGGIFLLDHDTFDVVGPWERDRGPQRLAYDFWWHLGHDVLVSSEWGTPRMIGRGVDPELLLAGQYGNGLSFWDLRRRRHLQRVELGEQYQMVLELRPSHDPTQQWGFAGVVLSLEDLSSSIWLWHRDGDKFAVTKVVDIPAEPADPEVLPPVLRGFRAAAPLLTDINLSLDDRRLYASCWGTGRLLEYDVSDPFRPQLIGEIRLGGMVRRAAHPSEPERPLNGGPQMVELSRDGRRAYLTNSLYSSWDRQFYPDGLDGWMVKADLRQDGAAELDPGFFVDFRDTGLSAHQVRLEGGDASSDSYCFPSA